MLEEFTKQLEICNTCPNLCQSVCPVYLSDGNQSHSPGGLLKVMNQLRKKNFKLDTDIANLSYQCVTCQACQEKCEHDINVPDILQLVRNKSLKSGLAPTEIKGFVEKFYRHNNPYSKDLLKKLHEIIPKKYFKPENNIVYYASCTTICKTPEIVKDTFSLFDKFKIDFVSPYTDTIQCCGYPLQSAGAEEDFVDFIEINYNSLKKYKQIITGSPACAHTLIKTYAKYNCNLASKVITINEFIEPYIKNINFRLKKRLRTKMMFHDPCYLSRYLKQIDLPRDLISSVTGFAPEEFFDNGKQCSCSGQGSTYSVIEKENANQITKKRLAECKERDINLVVTQCPSCVFKLKQNSKNFIIKDLISYLNDCIEGA
ncbi:hypothetical protein BVY03_01980 [bacterium K02(2017)]|nr:hypothetical protein BVY03_01980 [bacterium K02(2017)]